MSVRPKKRLGQHFLTDPNTVRRIVDAVDAPAGAQVVEIGPGEGALTGHLLDRYSDLIALEVDPEAVAQTNLARFWRRLGLRSYAELERWALDDVGRFWEAVFEDLGIAFSQPYTQILDTEAGGIERPAWCVGAGSGEAIDRSGRVLLRYPHGRVAVT